MDGLGDRLRARAKELGLADSEVARRVGLQQSRYHNYVADKREPDYATLLEICRVLHTTPDVLLGIKAAPRMPREITRLRERIEATAAAMPPEKLRLAVELMDTLATHRGGDAPPVTRKPGGKARRPRARTK